MLIPFILLAAIPSPLLGAMGHPSTPVTHLGSRDQVQVSPDGTCGSQSGGKYFCPFDKRCCSGYGFCGSGDDYCLTTLGCQADYVAPGSNACYAPKDGVTITPDGTCGKTGSGVAGYRCYEDSLICCSEFGHCGNTTAHCAKRFGCQSAYGWCSPV